MIVYQVCMPLIVIQQTWEIRASGFVTANSTTFDFGWVDAMKLTHYCWIYSHSQ